MNRVVSAEVDVAQTFYACRRSRRVNTYRDGGESGRSGSDHIRGDWSAYTRTALFLALLRADHALARAV